MYQGSLTAFRGYLISSLYDCLGWKRILVHIYPCVISTCLLLVVVIMIIYSLGVGLVTIFIVNTVQQLITHALESCIHGGQLNTTNISSIPSISLYDNKYHFYSNCGRYNMSLQTLVPLNITDCIVKLKHVSCIHIEY